MDIVIYVSGGESLSALRSLIEAIGVLPTGYSVRVVDVTNVEGGLPAEVLRVFLLRKEKTMPLLTVDGQPALSGRLPTAYEVLSLLPDDGTRPAVVTSVDSPVDFETATRLHISLNVSTLDVSVPFYTVLFGTGPAKVKPYYAKFELDDPPLNISLNERPFERPVKEGAVGHFGIQVKSSDTVAAAKERYLAAGFHVEEETETACCYAVQTKIWVGDPDGNRWEVFLTTQPESEVFCPADCLCYAQMSPHSIVALVAQANS